MFRSQGYGWLEWCHITSVTNYYSKLNLQNQSRDLDQNKKNPIPMWQSQKNEELDFNIQ